MARRVQKILNLVAVSLTLVLWQQIALAQDGKGIAAVVNDRIITEYDITQRILILERSGQARDLTGREKLLRERAIDQLINERLQEVEGKKEKITVSDIDLRRAHNLVERNVRIQKGTLVEFLQSNGIDPVSFDEKLRAEIVWNKIIRKKILPNIDVPDRDIDAELKRLSTTGGDGAKGPRKKLLQVRFDYGNNPSDEFRAKALKSATDLSNSAATCSNLAATAPGYPGSQVSDLGDIQVEDLRDRMQKAIRATPEGKLSAPVLTEQGVALFMVCANVAKASKLPDRLAIKQALSRNRIKRRSDRLLRELRRSAIIERR